MLLLVEQRRRKIGQRDLREQGEELVSPLQSCTEGLLELREQPQHLIPIEACQFAKDVGVAAEFAVFGQLTCRRGKEVVAPLRMCSPCREEVHPLSLPWPNSKLTGQAGWVGNEDSETHGSGTATRAAFLSRGLGSHIDLQQPAEPAEGE